MNNPVFKQTFQRLNKITGRFEKVTQEKTPEQFKAELARDNDISHRRNRIWALQTAKS